MSKTSAATQSQPRRRFGLTLIGLVIGFAASLVLGGCGSDAKTGNKGYVDGDGGVSILAKDKRYRPGEISGTSLQGKKISIKSMRGKPVVINVWASWCAPCRAEAPLLARSAKSLAGKVHFVGVDVRDPGSRSRPLAFERRFGTTYPSIYDPQGRNLLAFRGKVTPYTIPSTVILDAHGKVAASILGPVPSETTLADVIDDVNKGTA